MSERESLFPFALLGYAYGLTWFVICWRLS